MAINLTLGAARERIDPVEAPTLRNRGVLVEDPRRQRPRYFDGRFLAARDLIRDQQYFLTREADLGRAAGSGVAHGLSVSEGATPQTVSITAGEGLTGAGELVLLPRSLTIDLADIPQTEQLSARFGLSRLPVAPLRSRTGLFVLGLRPVEFTANPIGAYPTTLTGARTVEDGDVIEATAVVLIPWQDDGAADALDARRGTAARTIFTQPSAPGWSANVLPVAMLALQSNTLAWIDEAMVRRELGADRGDLPGLGFAPRGLRLAHLMQHQNHLADVVAQFHGRSFPAATQFPALPPAGPLPAGIIDTADFTQRYFPSEVDVDFSIIPEDELPALVEEALALPPIDFLAPQAALDLTAVLVLAPVPRAEFAAVRAKLTTVSRPLKAAAPNLVAQRKPLEILTRLRIPLPLRPVDVSNPSDAEWARLAKLDSLWFVRRRNLAYRDDLVGKPIAVAGGSDVIVERAITARIAELGLKPALDKVLAASSARAASSVISLLASPRIAASPALTAAALGALNAKPAGEREAGRETGRDAGLDHARVLQVGAELADGAVGNGLEKLERHAGDAVTRTALVSLASNDNWRKLDTAASSAEGTKLDQLSARLTRVPGASATPTPEREPVVTDPASKVSPAAKKPASASTAPATASAASTVGKPPSARTSAAKTTAAKPTAAKTTAAKKSPVKKAAAKKTAATKRPPQP
ncbi:hypothetical protein [Mitsuaria sp. 7]|uniref:hypothetical protein n=1 Tax=Mitsuaria sp. 7 TaxID=1658665 RepID=UPI0008373CB0|nr:hypothetical protein [Mitsuaria sp. 7]